MDASVFRTFRRALRTLARTPALTAASIATLALGIGANTALVTVAYGVLLRPLPFAHPERLVQLGATRESQGRTAMDFPLPEFADWERQARSFEALALFGFNQYSLSGDGEAEALRGAVVSGRFFSLLGVSPIAGRSLTPDDDHAASAVISERLWARRFARRADAIGGRILLNGQACTIVGVMPLRFTFPAPDVDVWAPAEYSATFAPPQWRMRGFRAFSIIGRLKAGVTLPQAREEVAAVARALSQANPRFNRDTGATVVLLGERMTARVRPALLLLVGAVGLLLVVACANVANLALARTFGRSREIAVHTALGASRRQLFARLLTESAALAVVGGGAGLFVATAILAWLARVAPADLPRLDSVGVDGSALLICAVLSLLSVVLFGTIPAMHAAGGAPADLLRDGRSASSRSTRRLHAWLVAGEIAISVVLVTGAALLARSLDAMVATDIGVADRGVLTLKLNLSSPAYADPAQQAAFLDRLVPALEGLPSVQSAGLSSHLPPSVSQMHTTVKVTNATTGQQDEYGVEIIAASEGLFRTLRIPLVGGRVFQAGDTSGATRVAVLSASAAMRLFPGGDAIGRTLAIGPRDPSARSRDPLVVGVVGDVRYSGFDAAPDGAVYMPYAQRPFRVMYAALQTAGTPAAVAADVRRAVASLDPSMAVSDVRRLDEVVAEAVSQPRFRTILMALMALLAVALAAAGIYGVLAYAVGQRTAEIGVRMALGAAAADVRRLIVRDAFALWAAGTAAGVVAALLFARVLGAFLYGIGRTDMPSLVAGPLLLALITLVASYVPARRATRVDPLVALRQP